MRAFFRTFYGKISMIFLILLMILGGIQIFVSVKSSVSYVCEASQKLHYGVARNLAQKIDPFVKDSINHAAVQSCIDELLVLNPEVDVYLLDYKGKILSFFDDPQNIKRTEVKVGPLIEYMDSSSYQKLPIFGDDPVSSSRKKVFSVAETEINKKQGYVYIILASAKYELAGDGLLGSYILGTSAIALTVTLLFGAIIGLILFFHLTKRLHKMTGAVREFEEGKYDRRIEIKSSDEVGELGLAFNHMAETIACYVQDLEKNDHLRRELIANISHDLRSPLASIQGYLETVLMKDADLSKEERRKFLETILKNVVNLNSLVHELFDLSKLDAKQTEPRFEAFSIAELAQDVVLKFQPQAEERKIHLLSKLPVNLPFVNGDIGLIERVLSNLIDNALRFTPEKGKITIQLEKQDQKIMVSVADTGSGIPEEDLPYVFDRFYRVEKSRSRNSGGSGLGLAIAKKIADAHKSSLHVDSKLGLGTTFSFNLQVYKTKRIKRLNMV